MSDYRSRLLEPVVNTVINCRECAQACEPANLWEECPKCMRTMLWRVSGVVSVCFVRVWCGRYRKKPVKPPPPQMAFTKAGVGGGSYILQTAHIPVVDGSLPEYPLRLYYKYPSFVQNGYGWEQAENCWNAIPGDRGIKSSCFFKWVQL